MRLTNYKFNDIISPSLLLGANFYINKTFDRKGTSYFRWPRKYPVDIHNQAQGIITFTKLNELDRSFIDFASIISIWTITNMFDRNGFFYYQKYKLITNKIPYMRWGQAWMFYALIRIVISFKKQTKIN